jgi:hypothetical protein
VPNFGTVTLKLANMFPSAADAGMSEISFGNPAFEEKLKVTAELRGPQDEAWLRHFLDPGFQSALLAVDEAEGRLSYGCSAISAAFMGDTFYLSLSRWEKRKLGPIVYEQPRGFMQQRLFLRERLDLEKAIHDMFNDVATAYRIIDQLHQNAADEKSQWNNRFLSEQAEHHDAVFPCTGWRSQPSPGALHARSGRRPDRTTQHHLILDASGSMWGQIDGVNKIVIAREVIADLLRDFPEDQALGLTVYGHRERGNCADIETLVSPAPGTRDSILEAVNRERGEVLAAPE